MPRAKYKKRADGRYGARIRTGRYDDNGEPIVVDLYSRISSADLEQKVNELKYKLNLGNYIAPSEITVSAYCDKWFGVYTAQNDDNTRASYANAIKKIKEDIGHFRMQDVMESDIQSVINEHFTTYRTDEIILLTLKRIFKQAHRDKIIADDVAENVKLKKIVKKTTKRALTVQEKEAIKLASFTDKQKAFVYILFFFGLRKEEALGLMKSDFDFKKQTLTISRALQCGSNRRLTKIKTTKNSASMRTLPINKAVISFFKAYISQLDSLYLFTNNNGQLMTTTQYTRFWNKIILQMNYAIMSEKEKAAVERLPAKMQKNAMPINSLTAHIFRHNYATMLYYSNVSSKKAIQLMGHTDVAMIMKIYAHLDEEKENVVQKLDEGIAL